MNYLAHCYLAENDPQSLVGNLMADAIPRALFDRLPPRVQRGILQHRRVDGFTDRHPLVVRSIRRLASNWGWFGGIIIDIYADHLLAETWDAYSTVTLREFCDRTNATLREQMDDMPEEARLLACRLISGDRLFSYGTIEGIEFALARVSERLAERIPHKRVQLQGAVPELRRLHPALREDFAGFFPELISFSRAWLAQSAAAPQPSATTMAL